MNVKQSTRQKTVVSVGIDCLTPSHRTWPPVTCLACMAALHEDISPSTAFSSSTKTQQKMMYSRPRSSDRKSSVCCLEEDEGLLVLCAADITQPQNHPQKVTLETLNFHFIHKLCVGPHWNLDNSSSSSRILLTSDIQEVPLHNL